MAFIGVGISHSAFGGVALGFLLGLDPLWSGIGFAVAVALLIEWAQAHPEYLNEPPVETEFRFLIETWPCNP